MKILTDKEDYLRVSVTSTDKERNKVEKVLGYLERKFGYSFNIIPHYMGGREYRCFCDNNEDFYDFKGRYAVAAEAVR